MIRLLAMGGYIFQSAAAFALIFAVSHILRPEDYTAFSLALATSQFFAVAAFEWVNLAAVRYLASARGDDAARLCSSLFSAEALSATVLVFGAVAASCSGRVEPVSVLLGLAIAIMQSLTDLHFTMIRVSGRLGISALLFVARASTQLAGAVSGALFWGTPTAALLGVLLGHALGILLSSIMDHSLLQWSPSRTKRSELAEFCRYGMLAAGASVTHLTVPMMIRFIVIGGLGDSC